MVDEKARAEALANRANSLNELIGALETEIDAVRKAREDAESADRERRAQEEALLAAKDRDQAEADQKKREQLALANTARIAPAIAFSSAKGKLVKPAAGIEVKGYGARSASLDQTQGILLATRASATIVTPADGWVVYAGDYRSFGQLVILNVGDNHHIVMSGMAESDISIDTLHKSSELKCLI